MKIIITNHLKNTTIGSEHLDQLPESKEQARFITLNKTCYNGLYRVNKKGIFNVPMGRYKNPTICDAQNLRNISTTLRTSSSHLRVADYQKVLIQNATENDFVYLDPPYSPVSSTANFTGYTNTGFTNENQRRLAEVFKN